MATSTPTRAAQRKRTPSTRRRAPTRHSTKRKQKKENVPVLHEVGKGHHRASTSPNPDGALEIARDLAVGRGSNVKSLRALRVEFEKLHARWQRLLPKLAGSRGAVSRGAKRPRVSR